MKNETIRDPNRFSKRVPPYRMEKPVSVSGGMVDGTDADGLQCRTADCSRHSQSI